MFHQGPVALLEADELHLRAGGDVALDTAAGDRRPRLPRHLAPARPILPPTPHARAAAGYHIKHISETYTLQGDHGYLTHCIDFNLFCSSICQVLLGHKKRGKVAEIPN